MISKTLASAGVLSLALTAVHVLGGGPDVHVPLLESNATDVLKGFVSVIWHAVTANLLICSAMLLIAAVNKTYRGLLTGLVLANYVAFMGLFLFYGITRLGSVLVMLPWIGFAAIIFVSVIGLTIDKKDSLDNAHP
ncbi:hypothetical protein [Pseudophaeobacter sp.]|uniref:hypothetical protein n=1 Tax=Pseudophaeobacter sp. TaxID=1971739 RepID=UPI0032968853